MSTNLINVNIDTLFEQHSVPEIDIVHKKIQTVVENKREELRTMVGERYRDLLKAADTIAAMQTSAGTLIEQVECVHTNCRNLNEQTLIGFKTADNAEMLPNKRSAKKLQNNYFSTMVQIKLLTSLPELIWTHIDCEQFYAATELFIFSRHISTGLQLDAKNALMQQLPVAKKQWEILRPFHMTIKQNVLSVLEREQVSTDVAVDCLLSLLLLEKCNLQNVMQTFLQLRCASFLNCLSKEHGESERRRVKPRILASLSILYGTIELLDKCFLDQGLLTDKMQEFSKENALPTITRMDNNDRQFAYLLPDIIANFRPKFESSTLEVAQVSTALQQWLEQTARIASVHLKQQFELVTNMQTIQEIKTTALSYKRQHNFAHIIERIELTQSLDFYESKYVPLINQRVRDIIRDSWTTAIQQTFDNLKQHVTQLTTSSGAEFEMWHEKATDLPLSLAEALNENIKSKKLLMKTKGYDADHIKLCSTFDRQLAAIVDELNVLLQEQTTRHEDKIELIEFLRETAQQQLTHLISSVKCLQHDNRASKLFVVRCCVALVELCPHLKICFCQQPSWRQWTGNHIVSSNTADQWQRICTLLEEEMLQLWLEIIDGILTEHSNDHYLPLTLSYETILEDFAQWQNVTLMEKDEQDNAIGSTIRIPNQPRISLQTYLFALIRALNIALPQTLPPKVLHAFNKQLLSQLLDHYQTLTCAEITKTSQNVALQLYYDLKFLQAIFVISRDERTLYERITTLQNELKDCIDPFDFELLVEHITLHVKSSVARLCNEFGVLTPPTQISLTDEPNVSTLSWSGSTSLWFPLLPIVTPNMSSAGSAFDLKSVTTSHDYEKQTTPTRKATTTTTGAGAARKNDSNKTKSFFGAMSQEWFR